MSQSRGLAVRHGDACKAPGTAWVNGFVPTSAAYPMHPNQAGEQNMANQVLSDR